MNNVIFNRILGHLKKYNYDNKTGNIFTADFLRDNYIGLIAN